MTELHKLSGIELGKLVRDKKVKPREVLDYFFTRIEAVNPAINAFVMRYTADAYQAADALEERIMQGHEVGPLAGVPTALKDFLPSKKGWKHTHGGFKSLVREDEYDSEYTKAVEYLGSIPIGKTNAPAFGFRGITDNHMFGPTSTPFDVTRNSGGSSGGSAAAVAAGLVPFAEGGDAGGSIRCPANWCNCFGFKPSAGLVPSVCRPDAWAATHPYCCGGPITRTVDDAALIISYMQHYDPRDPLSVPLPKFDYRAMYTDKERPLEGLKIAVTYNFDIFPDPEDEIAGAVSESVSMLAHLGAVVARPKFKFKSTLEDVQSAWLRGICVDTAIDAELWRKHGFDMNLHRDELPEEFFYWNDRAINSSMMDYRRFHDIRTDILDAHQDVFDRFDIIIAPVAGCMPPKNVLNGLAKGPEYMNGVKVDPLIGFCYTYLENMIGTPAASVPFMIDSATNLPIGLQIIAPRYKDANVFRVAYALEKENPWRNNYPEEIRIPV